jgi:hypothetical protein
MVFVVESQLVSSSAVASSCLEADVAEPAWPEERQRARSIHEQTPSHLNYHTFCTILDSTLLGYDTYAR